MPRPLQAFHDISTPHTSGYMCNLSTNSLLPSLRVTGNFSIECIALPLAIFGTTQDGIWLSSPESGRTAIDVEPFCDEMLMVSLGAGSDVATILMFERSGS